MMAQSCRICRIEGSESNPLYYPCKCRGSIKYVHQDCLKAWMKHSNRANRCDICDTEYKFTVIYKNGTPDKVPLIFLIKSSGQLIINGVKVFVPNLLRLLFISVLILIFPIYFFVCNSFLQILINNILNRTGNKNMDNDSNAFSLFFVPLPQNQTIKSFLFENDCFEGSETLSLGDYLLKIVIGKLYLHYFFRLAVPIAIFLIGYCIRQFIRDDHGYFKMIYKWFGNSMIQRYMLFRLRSEYKNVIKKHDENLKLLRQGDFQTVNHTMYEKSKPFNGFENEYSIINGDISSFKYNPLLEENELEQKQQYEYSLKSLYEIRFCNSAEPEEIKQKLLYAYQKRLENYEKTFKDRATKVLNAIDVLITAIDNSVDKKRLKYLYDRVCIIQLGSLKDYEKLDKIAKDSGFDGLFEKFKLDAPHCLFEPSNIIPHSFSFFAKGYSVKNIDSEGDEEAEYLIDSTLRKYFSLGFSNIDILDFSQFSGLNMDFSEYQSRIRNRGPDEALEQDNIDFTQIRNNEKLKHSRKVNPFTSNANPFNNNRRGDDIVLDDQLIDRMADMNDFEMGADNDNENNEEPQQQQDDNNIVINIFGLIPSFLAIIQYAGIMYGLGFVFVLIFYGLPTLFGLALTKLSFFFLLIVAMLVFKVTPEFDTWRYLYSHNALLQCILWSLNFLYQCLIRPVLDYVLLNFKNGCITNKGSKWLMLISYTLLIYVSYSYLNRIRYKVVVQHEVHHRNVAIPLLIFQVLLIIKILVIFGLELLVFPYYCGVLMDISISPLFVEDFNLQVPNFFDKHNVLTEVVSNVFASSEFMDVCEAFKRVWFSMVPSTFDFLEYFPLNIMYVFYWALGTSYMYLFALFVGMVRDKIARPGVLYFLKPPDDPNNKFFHETLVQPFALQIYRIFLSAAIYCLFIVIGIGLTSVFLRFGLPLALISEKNPQGVNFLPIYMTQWILTILLLIGIVIYYTADVTTLKYFVREYWIKCFKTAAGMFRFSSFILDNDISKERGKLVYRTIFHRILKAFILDIIRVHSLTDECGLKPDYTRPCSESNVKQFFEENVTLNVAFVPDGNYYRVPNSGKNVKSYLRTLFVPVTKDDIRLSYDKKFSDDYQERAKKNDQYYYSDSEDEFTPEQYYLVVYIPPNFKSRTFGFLITLWLYSIFIFCVTGFTSFAIGQYILSFFIQPTTTLYQMDLLSIVIGLFLICVIILPAFHSNDIIGSMRRVQTLTIIMFRDMTQILLKVISFFAIILVIMISCLVTAFYQWIFFYCVLIPYDIISSNEVKEHYRFAFTCSFWSIFFTGDSPFSIPSLFSILITAIFIFPFVCNIILAFIGYITNWNSYKFISNVYLNLFLPDGIIFTSLITVSYCLMTLFEHTVEYIPGSTVYKAVPQKEAIFFSKNNHTVFSYLDLIITDLIKDSVSTKVGDWNYDFTASFGGMLPKLNYIAVLGDNLKINITYLWCMALLSVLSIYMFFSLCWKAYKAYYWINGFVKQKFYASDIKLENAEQADDDDDSDFDDNVDS